MKILEFAASAVVICLIIGMRAINVVFGFSAMIVRIGRAFLSYEVVSK